MLSLVEKASRIAVNAHKEQMRKSDDSPYVVHPFMCAVTLAQHNFRDEAIAAALVHDVLEDTDFGEERLVEELGEVVVSIVRGVSENKALVWEDRKEKYAKTIKQASEETKAVSIADKIHNLQSMISEHERLGNGLWEVFTRGKDEQLWFNGLMIEAFSEWEHPLVEEYLELTKKFKETV